MIANVSILKEKFGQFNRQIFAGRLPEVPILLCTATSFVAQFKSRVRTLPDGRREHYDCVLRFSVAFDLTERELEDTLIHEMVHYFIAYNGLRDRTTHGPLFKAMIQSINDTHGRSIVISRRVAPRASRTDGPTAITGRLGDPGITGLVEPSPKKKWHIIAVLHFTDGTTGVKVLPRVVPRVIEYYRSVTAAPNILSVELYLHNDPYFHRFPTSTGRRCQAVPDSDLRPHLVGAHRLTVSGSTLLQH